MTKRLIRPVFRPGFLVLAGVLAGLAAAPQPLAAQSLRDNAEPAEVPPESYRGNQYVDSNGCVFIRAGVDGATTWVPRVSRAREVICGFQPTQVAGATRPASQQRPQAVLIEPDPAPQAEAQTAAASRTAAPSETQSATPRETAARTTAPAPRVTRPAAPRRAGAPMETVASLPARPATPRPAAAASAPAAEEAAAAPAAAPVRKTVAQSQSQSQSQSRCQGASALSQQYLSTAPNARCGPQSEPFVTYRDAPQVQQRADGSTRRIPGRDVRVYAGTSGATEVTNRTVIAPRATHAQRAASPRVIPPGYRPAFDDGRFNPQRAHQTLEGRREMLLVWTNTLPRQLVDQRSGTNVTHLFPDLSYPDMPKKRVVMVRRAPAATQAAPNTAPETAPVATARTATKSAPRPQAAPAPVVSSKAAPQKVRSTAPSHRYVQVGVLRPDGAKVAIQRLHGAGLPVRVRDFTHKGSPVRMVLTGPFKSQVQLERALATSKRLGFPGAKLRK
jgi:hypothetical protein